MLYRFVAVVGSRVSVSDRVSRRVVLLRARSQREGDHHVGAHYVRYTRRVRLQEQALEHQLLQTLLRLRQRLVRSVAQISPRVQCGNCRGSLRGRVRSTFLVQVFNPSFIYRLFVCFVGVKIPPPRQIALAQPIRCLSS